MLSLVPKWEYYFLYVEETYHLVAKAEWPIWDVMEMYVRYKNRIVSSATVVYYDGATWCPFEPQSSKYFPKMSYFFSKKVFFIFWEMELFGTKMKNFLMFSQKKVFLYFRKPNVLALRLKKKLYFFFILVFLIFFPEKAHSKKFLIFSQINVFHVFL